MRTFLKESIIDVVHFAQSPHLDSCGLLVPALNRVGEAWVNHFSDSRL